MVVIIEEVIEVGVEERFMRMVLILFGLRGYVNCILMNKGMRLSVGVVVRGVVLGEKEVDGFGKDNNKGRKKELNVGLYKDYILEVRVIVDLVVKDMLVSWVVGDYDNVLVYFKGRVVMLGDVVYVSLLFVGNGVV